MNLRAPRLGRSSAPRALLTVVATLLFAACAPCPEADSAALARQWQSTLDTQLRPGMPADQVVAFLASRHVPSMHQPEASRVWSMFKQPGPDTRWQCRVVSTALEIDCRLDAHGALRACTVTAVHTGP